MHTQLILTCEFFFLQVETINRLLKKQSRPKNRRNALSTADDRSQASGSNTKGASTPIPQSLLKEALSHSVAEREGNEDADMGTNAIPVEPSVAGEVPSMFRWVSRTKTRPGEGGSEMKYMTLTFSVPVGVMNDTVANDPAAGDAMQVDEIIPAPIRPPRTVAQCDIDGCTQSRKYKLVKDETKGACGMLHLKQLESPCA